MFFFLNVFSLLLHLWLMLFWIALVSLLLVSYDFKGRIKNNVYWVFGLRGKRLVIVLDYVREWKIIKITSDLEIYVATNLGFLTLRRKHPKRRDKKKIHKMICLRWLHEDSCLFFLKPYFFETCFVHNFVWVDNI